MHKTNYLTSSEHIQSPVIVSWWLQWAVSSEHIEWWMEGKTEKGCLLFISAEENETNLLNVVVDVCTDRSVRGSCQLCLIYLAASVEFCQGERSILISTNRKTGIWQRARAPLTPRLHECRRAFAIQVLLPLSYVLDVSASLFPLCDIMVYRQTCHFVHMATRFFIFIF